MPCHAHAHIHAHAHAHAAAAAAADIRTSLRQIAVSVWFRVVPCFVAFPFLTAPRLLPLVVFACRSLPSSFLLFLCVFAS
jgi:hypothetical protein